MTCGYKDIVIFVFIFYTEQNVLHCIYSRSLEVPMSFHGLLIVLKGMRVLVSRSAGKGPVGASVPTDVYVWIKVPSSQTL